MDCNQKLPENIRPASEFDASLSVQRWILSSYDCPASRESQELGERLRMSEDKQKMLQIFMSSSEWDSEAKLALERDSLGLSELTESNSDESSLRLSHLCEDRLTFGRAIETKTAEEAEDNQIQKPMEMKNLTAKSISSTEPSQDGNGILKEYSSTDSKKRVRIIDNLTVESLIQQKAEREKELSKHLKRLCEGFYFKKYCISSERVNSVKVTFSHDFKYVAWGKSGKLPTVESMMLFKGMTEGLRTKNFKRYLKRGHNIEEEAAVSLVLGNRSLDLVARSKEEKEEFMRSLRVVKSYF